MNSSPSLIVILIKHEGSERWTIFHVAESHQENDVKRFMYHCRDLAAKNNTNEKYKLEFYEPSD